MQWWNRGKSFVQEVVAETKKVTWPTQSEVLNTTTVVLAASFIFGIFLYLCDFAFLKAIQRIFGIFGIDL